MRGIYSATKHDLPHFLAQNIVYYDIKYRGGRGRRRNFGNSFATSEVDDDSSSLQNEIGDGRGTARKGKFCEHP